jgi:hypothetical protein
MLDLDDGRIVAYWTQRECDARCLPKNESDTINPATYHIHVEFDVTTWDGHKIADGYAGQDYKVYGFYGVRHTRWPVAFFLMEKEGEFTYWYGTGYGPCMYLRAKRSKRGYRVFTEDYVSVLHPEPTQRYECLKCHNRYMAEYTIRRHIRFYCK